MSLFHKPSIYPQSNLLADCIHPLQQQALKFKQSEPSMRQQQKQNTDSRQYGEQKIHEMVMIKYKSLRNGGILQSLEDIYTKQPQSRITKDNYLFSFDNVKNHIQERINDKSKLKKILNNEMSIIRDIEIKNLKQVTFDNEDQLYAEKLKSGLPIFKSIQFLRYQDNEKWTEFFGEERPFIVDQSTIDFSQIKVDINKIKLFIEDEQTIPKINLEFVDQNTLQVKYDRFPTLYEIQKRADVMAKLLLFNIYTDQHRKLKQAWKNDENYQDMQKNQKRLKAYMQPQKTKEGENEQEEELMKAQVKKVLFGIEERANMIANEQFKQLNGEKAVQTKKSLERLKRIVKDEKNPKLQLKFLIAYKQKKSW